MNQQDHEQQARAEASVWFAELSNTKVSLERVAEFQAWRRNPRNAQAYDAIDSLWRRSGALSDDAEMRELTRQTLARTDPNLRQRRRVQAGLAMCAFAMALAVGFVVADPLAPRVENGQQPARRVMLDDGSQIWVDAQTKLKVDFSRSERRVELVRGRALFDVAHDPSRPFAVHAGRTTVTALGTRFDASRVEGGLQVNLVEGSVRVERSGQGPSRTLRPGQQYSDTAGEPSTRRIDVVHETAWVRGEVFFRETPLAEAVTQINRYRSQPIALEVSPGQTGARISGTFRSDDTTGFVAAIAELYDLEILQHSNRVVLRSR